ncbi:hypothetical protein JL2886_01484 [Phaeobacter gallaeciensis]|uniref:Uncharacterized protein n=1 Tax=Phaeobacter gallaeciensis TaxID=60890 RepID=A0A1B0ZQJ2_9RHOB|nr:hypothetical protein JL2886_01484 [Phaeobacter gallaeciensis]
MRQVHRRHDFLEHSVVLSLSLKISAAHVSQPTPAGLKNRPSHIDHWGESDF